MRIFQTKRSFRKEFKRQIKLAIIAAVGFTVAFSGEKQYSIHLKVLS